MGAWAYCQKCSHPLKVADLKEALKGTQSCPACGHEREVDENEKEIAADALLDRVHALEEKVADLRNPSCQG